MRLDPRNDSSDQPDQVGTSEDEAEARMRQALGLFGQRPAHADSPTSDRRPTGGGGGGHMQIGARRHRFVQDGEVPVSVVRGRREQAATPANAPRANDARDRMLDDQAAERSGREQAERRLAEAQTLIKTLQTRLGHAELERDEAVSEARSLREQLAAERAAVEQRLAEERVQPEPKRERAARVEPEVDEPGSEPEPVKWWL